MARFKHNDYSQLKLVPVSFQEQILPGTFEYPNGSSCWIHGRQAVKFTGAKRVCGPCPLRPNCLRHPEHTPVRQVVFFTGRTKPAGSATLAKRAFSTDSLAGKTPMGVK